MKKLSTKIISVILSFSLIFALVPPTAFSAGNNGASLSLELTTDRSEYTDGSDILIGGVATNRSQNDFAEEIEISLSATPAVKLDTDTITIDALAAGQSQQLLVTAKADRVRFSEGVFQAFYDIITGHFYSALWKFFAAVSPKHECIEIEINNVPAVIMYKVNSDVNLNGGNNENYNVSFNLNYEGAANNIPSQTVMSGNKVSRPADPQRDGYTFTGWYEDALCEKEFDFNKSIYGNKVLYAGWIAVSALKLTTNLFEIAQASGEELVYFYVESTVDVDYISLYKNNEFVSQMNDNGAYTANGDDLMGDGIYSCRLYIQKSEVSEYSFFAKVGNVSSNSVNIKVIAPLTEEELEDIEEVDLTIQNDIFGAENYDEMTEDEKVELSETVLENLANNGLIVEESIIYNEHNLTYTFTYTSGVLGTVMVKDWAADQNGSSSENVSSESVANEAVMTTNTTASTSSYIGDAIILWSFDQSWDEAYFRVPFYNQISADWTSKGLNTTVDWNTTVEDYKNLSEYEVIIFSGHGEYTNRYINGSGAWLPCLMLCEDATKAKDKDYSLDLQANRIAKLEVADDTKYVILPKFFTDYYGDDGLDGSFIFAENCQFKGAGDIFTTDMSLGLGLTSAESIIGFHNSVMAEYSRDLMNSYVLGLIEGKTTAEAFADAKKVHGDDDSYKATPFLTTIHSDARLVHIGIENGNFEDSSTPTYWDTVGDTRVVSYLGTILPRSGSRMAIISTGIGSGESIYLEGTEGSYIQQTFRVTSGNSQLSYRYNVVSEEPMEYVDSKFDDTFEVEIIDKNGNVVKVITKETVNSSTWYSVSGIDFDGGDKTVYQTGWNKISVDLSEYVGENVTIRFKVYDKGDSIYDTAVLIDNVVTTAE